MVCSQDGGGRLRVFLGSRLTDLKPVFLLSSECGRVEVSDELWACKTVTGITQPCSEGADPGDKRYAAADQQQSLQRQGLPSPSGLFVSFGVATVKGWAVATDLHSLLHIMAQKI